jgi:hypothetical protein
MQLLAATVIAARFGICCNNCCSALPASAATVVAAVVAARFRICCNNCCSASASAATTVAARFGHLLQQLLQRLLQRVYSSPPQSVCPEK